MIIIINIHEDIFRFLTNLFFRVIISEIRKPSGGHDLSGPKFLLNQFTTLNTSIWAYYQFNILGLQLFFILVFLIILEKNLIILTTNIIVQL